ncbi:RxLR-like protein [Phytophthora cinnamomi]|uniref:RxLR-like protein n=1 Tax=Phytophthora cinnamomi TaxID=4785 RepID=UPI00355A6C8D|nr:RxLR-like protein [Phytophthora cinnamomi]
MARPRRHSPLLALALAACAHVCDSAAARTHARFFLPDATAQQQSLKPVLQQLEALGISQFEADASWGRVATDSAEFDLVWSAAAPPFAQLELPHQFQAKVNHLPGAEQLTSPDALNQHVAAQKKHAKFFFDFVPEHFELPRDQDKLTAAYADVKKRFQFSPKRGLDGNVYRRFLLRQKVANGDDDTSKRAEVFVTDKELQTKLQSSEFSGKTVVVDHYVEPLLLDNHKFRVGFYVAVTSTDPLRVYEYDHPQIKIAKAEYPNKLKVDSDPAAYNFDQYIAPWDFPDLQADFYELPSATRVGTNAWHVLKKYLRKQGIDTKHLQDEVDASIAKIVLSSRDNFRSEQAKVKRSAAREGEKGSPSDLNDSFFDMWKFDFEFDDMGKPWLVRVVSNPSMEGSQSVLATDEAIKKPSTEYARRGSFNLIFPSFEQELSKYLSSELSEHDIAFDRYLKSLSSGYSDLEDFPASDRAVVCVYREHCSNHGDCVNGACSCDSNYEGRTCYIPKDFDHEEHIQQETGDAGGQDAETWKEKVENLVWNRGDSPDGSKRPMNGVGDASASGTVFLLVLLGVFLFVIYRVFMATGSSAGSELPHDGKAM